VLSDLVQRVHDDPVYAFETRVLSATASLGEGPRFQKLFAELKPAGLGITEWKKAVAKRRSELKKAQQVANAKSRGKRIFERGDDTELAVSLLDCLADRDREGRPRHQSLVFSEGLLHAYKRELGTWQPIPDRDESLIIQGFAGSIVGEKGVLHVNERAERGSIRLAHRRVHQPGFFEEAPLGFVFQNGFVEVRKDGLKLRPHHGAQDGYWSTC
jgi:hypothetical protein